MKHQHSIGTPVLCTMSAIGWMSLTTVRAAQLALYLQTTVPDLSGQPFDISHHMQSGTGQADVRRVDAETIQQMQDSYLLIDRRGADGWRLKAISQRLVVESDDRWPRRRRFAIPVVDQRIIHDRPSFDASSSAAFGLIIRITSASPGGPASC